MRMVEDDILGASNAPAGKAYRPNANHIVVFITDGNPSQISYCDQDYSFSTGYSYKREDLIKSLKAKATRIVPVGVGKGISSAFLSSLSHNMPSHAVINGVNTALPDFVRVDGGYTQMNALLDTIATVACPTAPPTAPAPTFAPTTAVSVLRTTKLYRRVLRARAPRVPPSLYFLPFQMPTTSPTFSCTATCTKDYQENACDMTNGFCYYHTTACAPADRRCGCNGNMLANAGTGLCTSAPTASPTTASPSTAPTNTPTFAPSTPTKEPTYWVLFNDGIASQDEAVAVTAATAAGVGLGAFAIVAIVLGVIALIVLLAMIAGGVGIFAVRKKLFGVDMTVDGKNLHKGNAITVGSKIEMTESTAKGMLARGEVTPEQFAEMGFTVGDGGEALPGYAESVQ